MKYFTAYNFLPLEATPTLSPNPLPVSPFTELIWQCNNHSDCHLRRAFYLYQHPGSCNFPVSWDTAGSLSLCEKTSALLFLTFTVTAATCAHTRLSTFKLEKAGPLELWWGPRPEPPLRAAHHWYPIGSTGFKLHLSGAHWKSPNHPLLMWHQGPICWEAILPVCSIDKQESRCLAPEFLAPQILLPVMSNPRQIWEDLVSVCFYIQGRLKEKNLPFKGENAVAMFCSSALTGIKKKETSVKRCNPSKDTRWVPREWEGAPQHCCCIGFTPFNIQAHQQSFTAHH